MFPNDPDPFRRAERLLKPRWIGILAVTAWALGACSEHLLQTASLERTQPPTLGSGGSAGESISCSTSTSGELPSGAQFGEGDAVALPAYAAGGYTVSQGPGISVVARDAFRLYVNGSLVFESEAPRIPVFVPLVLPPGENVIALSIAADEGTPVALVHLDELAQAIVSDDTWKISDVPEDGWQFPGFDDSTWVATSTLAALGDLPGCSPEEDFPLHSDARWMGPPHGYVGTVALRKVISIVPSGFGRSTTGGEDADPEMPGSWAELESLATSDDRKVILLAEGVHDFRRQGDEIADQEVCPTECSNEPGKFVYEVLLGDDTCPNALTMIPRDDRKLRLGSNTTILGLGRGAAVRGVTFDFQASENIIVRNVALFDINPDIIEAGDAFGLVQPRKVWIDHATIKWTSDGFSDIGEGSEDITLSYVNYDGRTEYSCDGHHAVTSFITNSEVTIHHSRFDHVRSNAPRASGSGSRVHLFNNVFSNVLSWAIGSACQAVILVEGTTFENVVAVATVADCGTDAQLGYLDFPTGSNLYRDGMPVFLASDGSEPRESGFTPPYEYPLEHASDAWPKVLSRAGAGGPWAQALVLD